MHRLRFHFWQGQHDARMYLTRQASATEGFSDNQQCWRGTSVYSRATQGMSANCILGQPYSRRRAGKPPALYVVYAPADTHTHTHTHTRPICTLPFSECFMPVASLLRMRVRRRSFASGPSSISCFCALSVAIVSSFRAMRSHRSRALLTVRAYKWDGKDSA